MAEKRVKEIDSMEISFNKKLTAKQESDLITELSRLIEEKGLNATIERNITKGGLLWLAAGCEGCKGGNTPRYE